MSALSHLNIPKVRTVYNQFLCFVLAMGGSLTVSRQKRYDVSRCELCGSRYSPRNRYGGLNESKSEPWPSLRDYCPPHKNQLLYLAEIASGIFHSETVTARQYWEARFVSLADAKFVRAGNRVTVVRHGGFEERLSALGVGRPRSSSFRSLVANAMLVPPHKWEVVKGDFVWFFDSKSEAEAKLRELHVLHQKHSAELKKKYPEDYVFRPL